jgi:hypothetical protein
MHKVLEEILNLLDGSTLVSPPFNIRRIQVGTLDEAYNGQISPNDFPAIIITAIGEPTPEPSFWANHIQKKYEVLFYVFFRSRRPNTTRIEVSAPGNDITISEVSNEMQRLLRSNKKLNGIVKLWSGLWEVTPLKDPDGNYYYEIKTRYIDDLIPFDSSANNQTDTIPQTH